MRQKIICLGMFLGVLSVFFLPGCKQRQNSELEGFSDSVGGGDSCYEERRQLAELLSFQEQRRGQIDFKAERAQCNSAGPKVAFWNERNQCCQSIALGRCIKPLDRQGRSYTDFWASGSIVRLDTYDEEFRCNYEGKGIAFWRNDYQCCQCNSNGQCADFSGRYGSLVEQCQAVGKDLNHSSWFQDQDINAQIRLAQWQLYQCESQIQSTFSSQVQECQQNGYGIWQESFGGGCCLCNRGYYQGYCFSPQEKAGRTYAQMCGGDPGIPNNQPNPGSLLSFQQQCERVVGARGTRARFMPREQVCMCGSGVFLTAFQFDASYCASSLDQVPWQGQDQKALLTFQNYCTQPQYGCRFNPVLGNNNQATCQCSQGSLSFQEFWPLFQNNNFSAIHDRLKRIGGNSPLNGGGGSSSVPNGGGLIPILPGGNTPGGGAPGVPNNPPQGSSYCYCGWDNPTTKKYCAVWKNGKMLLPYYGPMDSGWDCDGRGGPNDICSRNNMDLKQLMLSQECRR